MEKSVHEFIEVQEKTPTKRKSVLVIDDDAVHRFIRMKTGHINKYLEPRRGQAISP